MRTRRAIIFATMLVLFFLPISTWADGITWTLNEVALNDGGAVTGSFVYDADTNTYSSPDVTSTSGSLFSGAPYTTITNAFFDNSNVLGLGPNPAGIPSYAGETFLELMFNNSLTDAGGVDSVTVFEIVCTNATCSSPIERKSLPSATVTTPEPSSLLLLALSLLGLLAILPRRS